MIFEGFVELDDVWVVHDLHDSNFLFESIQVLHLRFSHGLNSSSSTSRFVSALAYCAVRALPKLLFVNVVELLNLARVVNDEAGMFQTTFLHVLFLDAIRAFTFATGSTSISRSRICSNLLAIQ